MDISAIDKNFEIKTNIDRDDIRFYDADQTPFSIYGVFRENGKFCRMPESVSVRVSKGVHTLNTNTAGGRVRFVTDSKYIAIKAEMHNIGKMSHFAYTGSIGFDVYADNRYKNTYMPPHDIEDGYESVRELGEKKLREITINMPLYSGVKKLYIGLSDSAQLKAAEPYKNKKPIVYYGSSITQGGCASRPGMSYQSIISRRFNYDYVNLGFSGGAKGEDAIVDYIKGLDMSMFVMDYDHNAPDVQHLINTHEKMFKAIRGEHPDLPVIIMTRPKYFLNEDDEMRRKVVEQTYNNALAAGDKNVYFADGRKLAEMCGDEGTVDGTHPTDYGFSAMAKYLGDMMEKIEIM